MRWFRKKRFFFLFYGEHAARTRLFFKISIKIGRPRAKTTLITMMKIWPTWLRTVNSNFLTKRQSEGPGVKPSISRLFCSNPERFCPISGYATRCRIAPFFLTAPHSAVGTKAVKHFPKLIIRYPLTEKSINNLRRFSLMSLVSGREPGKL